MSNFHLPWGCILIIGQQRSGKSHLIKNIIADNKDLSYGVVFSHTVFNEGNFSYIPKKYLFSQFQEDVVSNLMRIQEAQPKSSRKKCFVIIDDCLDGWNNSKILFNLATQLYHYNCTLVISTQYCNKVPAAIRENAQLVCIFPFEGLTRTSLDALYESFGASNFNKLADFRQFLQSNITQKYQFVLYSKNVKNASDRYKITKCKAKIGLKKLKY